MIKKWSVVALFFIVIGVVGAFITYSPHEITEEEVIIQEEITSIELTNDNGKIEFLPTDDSVITIKDLQSRDEKRRATLKTNVDGNQLFIEYEQKIRFTLNFSLRPETQQLKIYLPKKQYELLKVDSGNGLIKAEGLNVNQVHLTVSNGGVNLDDIQAENHNVQSSNGKVVIRNSSGDITGTTSNGKIEIITPDLNRNLDLESSNGKIIISTEKEPTNNTFDVQTGNGSVDIMGKYTGSTIIGDGENVVKLRTGNGSISVK